MAPRAQALSVRGGTLRVGFEAPREERNDADVPDRSIPSHVAP